MSTFIFPKEFQGTAELTASNGLVIEESGLWKFDQLGYIDTATFTASLTYPSPMDAGTLYLTAQNWTIATVGNQLTDYTDPESGITYSSDRCRITVTGRWQVQRKRNSDSYNSFGVEYTGATETDLGTRSMTPNLLNYSSPVASYQIQGSAVTGGASNTFSNHLFYCRVTESTNTVNSNRQYQSNTVVRPTWIYHYSKSWQID